jgi:hypothetical protein
MSENQSFDFLIIADQGSIILTRYQSVLSSKKKEGRTTFYFGKCFLSKNDENYYMGGNIISSLAALLKAGLTEHYVMSGRLG